MDQSTLIGILSAVGGAAVMLLVQEFRGRVAKTSDWQQRLMIGALGVAGMMILRQYERRGDGQETQAVFFAALQATIEERFKTIFKAVDEVRDTVGEIMRDLRALERGEISGGLAAVGRRQ